MSIERPIPDEHAPPGSINYYTNQLHAQRLSGDAQGRLLLLPRTKLIVVPYERRRPGGWACVVVSVDHASPATRTQYPVGGYNLFIGDDEIETAIAITDLAYDPTGDPGHEYYGIEPERPT